MAASNQIHMGSSTHISCSRPSSSIPPPSISKNAPPDVDKDGFLPVRSRRSPNAWPRNAQPTGTRSVPPQVDTRFRPNYLRNNQMASRNSRTQMNMPEHRRPVPRFNVAVPANRQSDRNLGTNQGKDSSTWADLVKNGGIKSNFDLEFISPIKIGSKNIVTIKKEVCLRTENKWSSSVLAYVYGPRPYYHHFRDYVTRTWNPDGNFEIYVRSNGFFLIRFSNVEDCNKVFNGGPYFISGKLIILKKWSKNLILDKDLLSTIPIWIRLPEINLRLWDKEAFSAIASVVGFPLKLDEPTAKETRLSYARILVEVKADADLPNEVTISLFDGENIVQSIEYEWLPPKCKFCMCFGHNDENCTVKKDLKGKNIAEETSNTNATFSDEMVVDESNLTNTNVADKIGNPVNPTPLPSNMKGVEKHIKEKSSNLEEISPPEVNEFSISDQEQSSGFQEPDTHIISAGNIAPDSKEESANMDIQTPPLVISETEKGLQGQDLKYKSSPLSNDTADFTKQAAPLKASNAADIPAQIVESSHLEKNSDLCTEITSMNDFIKANIDIDVCSDMNTEVIPKLQMLNNKLDPDLFFQNASIISSGPPPGKKDKKKKSRSKKIEDILYPESTEDAEDSDFRNKYIVRNKAWDKLKIQSKKSFKKKGKNLEVREEDSSYSDSL